MVSVTLVMPAGHLLSRGSLTRVTNHIENYARFSYYVITSPIAQCIKRFDPALDIRQIGQIEK